MQEIIDRHDARRRAEQEGRGSEAS